MNRHFTRRLYILPLAATAVMIAFAPLCLAESVNAPLLPSPNNPLPPSTIPLSTNNIATLNTAPNEAPCKLCASYQRVQLQKLLIQYQALANNGGWPAWEVGKKIMPDHNDTRIPTLRQILTITGDYPSASGVASSSTLYDKTLLLAVKHFQERHGLNADGTLGASTQTALNTPVEKRITQILSTLERLPATAPAAENKYILVNLPAYQLYAIEQDKTALTMRVIVGNRANHTPLFNNHITDVVFNPPWHVPARIARAEMLPKLRNNPEYFIRANFTVTQDGVPVDPMSVDPNNGTLSFKQNSGRGNALGKLKFNLPDNDDVYLHSTSSPQLFAKEDRALSHGCIRLEKPQQLAYFVMQGVKGWDPERIDRAYEGSAERNVRVEDVPVHLVYWTAFVDETGAPHFYNDIYKKDGSTTTTQIEPDPAKNPLTVAMK